MKPALMKVGLMSQGGNKFPPCMVRKIYCKVLGKRITNAVKNLCFDLLTVQFPE